MFWGQSFMGFRNSLKFIDFRKVTHCKYCIFCKPPRQVSHSISLTNRLIFLQQNIYICVRPIPQRASYQFKFCCQIYLTLFKKISSFQSFWNFRSTDEKITTYNEIIILILQTSRFTQYLRRTFCNGDIQPRNTRPNYVFSAYQVSPG